MTHNSEDQIVSPVTTKSWLRGALEQRCPRCRQGKIFRRLLTMHELCPHCNMRFEREPGYFVGSMYISYAMAIAFLVPMFFLLQWLLPTWSNLLVPLIAVAFYVPLIPFAFRYARVLWLYMDRYFSPSDISSHEKHS